VIVLEEYPRSTPLDLENGFMASFERENQYYGVQSTDAKWSMFPRQSNVSSVDAPFGPSSFSFGSARKGRDLLVCCPMSG
jgi:hypothetical protein